MTLDACYDIDSFDDCLRLSVGTIMEYDKNIY